MLALNANKLQKMGLYASLIAVVGLGSSILSGNEHALVGSVSIMQQKAFLFLASAIASRALYLRVRRVRVRRNLGANHDGGYRRENRQRDA
jgi:hypothetical protein